MFLKLLKDWKGKPPGEKIDVPDEYLGVVFDWTGV